MPKVIDFHAHYPRQKDFIPRLLGALPEVGIDHICLCAAGEQYGQVGNEDVREAFAQHPDRITGLALVRLGIDPPHWVDEAVKQGFRGIKIINPTAPYDHQGFFPYYERMEARQLVALFHTGIVARSSADGALGINSLWMAPSRLDAVARSFPGLNIVAAHLGAPWHEEASMLARIHPNFYVDLTGAAWGGWRVNKTPDFYRYHFFWPNAWEKVLFGTDIVTVEDLRPAREVHDRIIDPLGLPRETVVKIYGGTAARLLHLAG